MIAKDCEFSSERLSYRGIAEADAADIVRWRGDPDNYRFFFDARPITLEEHLEWFRAYLEDGTRYDFVIADPQGRPVGTVGLSRITGESCEVSYMIGEEGARGQGYAKEAVRAVSELAFRELGVGFVEARILPGNEASVRVARGGGSVNASACSGWRTPGRPVLLLTNNDNTDGFMKWLAGEGYGVVRLGERLEPALAREIEPRIAVSFNYRHILSGEAIAALGCPAVNVHCSVLPYNRGASPNFFSYYENTPKGVTVHELSEGLDKGGILFQEVLDLGEGETFRSSYGKLVSCGTRLLADGWGDLLAGRVRPARQRGRGSYHSVADFERVRARFPFDLDEPVRDWKGRFGLE